MAHVPRPGHSRRTHGGSTRPTHGHAAFEVPLVANLDYYEQVQVDQGEQVTAGQMAPGSVGPGVILPGAIQDLTPFASDLRPVAIVDSLPTLPDDSYPEFSYVVLTTDERLYKNIADVWVLGVDGADIVVDSITAGQIAAGAISASEIAAGAITTEKLGLVDEGGTTLLDGAGFQGSWKKFIESRVYNSDFAAPPPTPASNIDNVTNPLPYWTVTKRSGTAINAKSVVDSGAASGRVVELTMLSGAAGDDTYVEQIVPISGNRSLINAYRVFVSFRCTSNSAAQVYGEIALLDNGGSSIGIGTTFDETCTTVNAEADDTLTFSISDNFLKPTPASAAFIRIRAGLKRDAAANGDTVTVHVTGVHVEQYVGEILLPDTTDSSVKGGRIFQDNSRMWLISRHGDANASSLDLDGNDGSVQIVAPGGFFTIGDLIADAFFGSGGSPLIQTGTFSVNMGGAAFANQAVSFAREFANTPIVVVSRSSGSGTAPKVSLDHQSVTTTGFTGNGRTGDGSTSAATVDGSYIAIDPTFFG